LTEQNKHPNCNADTEKKISIGTGENEISKSIVESDRGSSKFGLHQEGFVYQKKRGNDIDNDPIIVGGDEESINNNHSQVDTLPKKRKIDFDQENENDDFQQTREDDYAQEEIIVDHETNGIDEQQRNGIENDQKEDDDSGQSKDRPRIDQGESNSEIFPTIQSSSIIQIDYEVEPIFEGYRYRIYMDHINKLYQKTSSTIECKQCCISIMKTVAEIDLHVILHLQLVNIFPFDFQGFYRCPYCNMSSISQQMCVKHVQSEHTDKLKRILNFASDTEQHLMLMMILKLF
jgi:hypothetical protein